MFTSAVKSPVTSPQDARGAVKLLFFDVENVLAGGDGDRHAGGGASGRQ